MIVRAISEGDLTNHIAIIARLETALYAIEQALKVATFDDDKADLGGMATDLRELIRWHKHACGLT